MIPLVTGESYVRRAVLRSLNGAGPAIAGAIRFPRPVGRLGRNRSHGAAAGAGRGKGKVQMASMRNRSRVGAIAALVTLVLTASLAASASAEDIPPDAVNSPLLQPLDAQEWVDQAELTWDAYKPDSAGRVESATTSQGSQNQYKTAIILVDYSDQPFLITQAPGTHPFGNPQPGWTPVRAGPGRGLDVRLLRRPERVQRRPDAARVLDGGQPRQDRRRRRPSSGRTACPGKQFEYGIASDFNNPVNQYCPQGHTCNRNIRTDGGNAWRAAIGCAVGPLRLRQRLLRDRRPRRVVHVAGVRRDAVDRPRDRSRRSSGRPARPRARPQQRSGNPMTNWASTRYVPWTSWRAAANHWPNAGGGTSTQAESSGQSVFAHEFSHLRGLPDNYNNPFADNERNFTGYWEMMSRGTFNGPGGTHNRWQVPNAGRLRSRPAPHAPLQEPARRAGRRPTRSRSSATRSRARASRSSRSRRASRSRTATSSGSRWTSAAGGDLAGTCANQGYIGAFFYCPNRTGSAYSALPARGRRPRRERLVRARATACSSRRAAGGHADVSG